jgi:hypothetical protein
MTCSISVDVKGSHSKEMVTLKQSVSGRYSDRLTGIARVTHARMLNSSMPFRKAT